MLHYKNDNNRAEAAAAEFRWPLLKLAKSTVGAEKGTCSASKCAEGPRKALSAIHHSAM